MIDGYRAMGARDCVPIYNALDPATHFPVASDPRFAADLAFLGNRLPDRDVRVAEFLLHPARMLPEKDFLLGGSGWGGCHFPDNLRSIGHLGTADHNAFNVTPRAILNIARDSMAACGLSPATRVFEAVGAGACLITHAWQGIEMFLTPGKEVLVARDGQEVTEIMTTLTDTDARLIGAAAGQANRPLPVLCGPRCHRAIAPDGRTRGCAALLFGGPRSLLSDRYRAALGSGIFGNL